MWLLSLIHSNINILILLRPWLMWTTTIVHLLFLLLHYIMQTTLGLNLHYILHTTLHLFIVLIQIKWQYAMFFPTARDHNMLTLLSNQCMNSETVERWFKYIILQGCACEWAGWAKMMQYIKSPFCFLLFCSFFLSLFLPEFCFHVVFPRGPLSVMDLPTFFFCLILFTQSQLQEN